MNNKTITAANSTFVLSCPAVGFAAVSIEGYSADAAFATEAADTAETALGVDGKMSAGWVPRLYKQTVSLQADSDSRAIFDAIAMAQDSARNVFKIQAVISMPSIGTVYTMVNGVLSHWKPMPDAKKVLQPTEFVITWERVNPISI